METPNRTGLVVRALQLGFLSKAPSQPRRVLALGPGSPQRLLSDGSSSAIRSPEQEPDDVSTDVATTEADDIKGKKPRGKRPAVYRQKNEKRMKSK